MQPTQSFTRAGLTTLATALLALDSCSAGTTERPVDPIADNACANGAVSHRSAPHFCVSQPDFNSSISAVVQPDYWTWFMQEMDDVGARATRISGGTLAWVAVEPVLGQELNFSLADTFIDNMAKGTRSIDLVITINPSIGLMSGADRREPAGIHREQYVRFLTAAFDRYAPNGASPYNPAVPVRYFQVGNEIQDVPELTKYLDIVEVTAEVARRYPGVELIGVGDSAPPTFNESMIDALAARGMGDVVTGLDIHSWNPHDVPWLFTTLRDLRAQLDSRGLCHVRLWSLENGTYQGCPVLGGWQLPTLTERDQARHLIDVIVAGWLNGLDVLCWNNLVDWQNFGGEPAGPFSAMGLIGDGEGNACEDTARRALPRTAYFTFQRLAEALGDDGVRPAGLTDLGLAQGSATGVTFAREGGSARAFVVWTKVDLPMQAEIEVATSEVRVVPLVPDFDGNPREVDVPVVDGHVQVMIEGGVLVVESGF
jgi:hypothetical protein